MSRPGLYERMAQASGKAPGWHEGWDAHAVGWPLYKGHTLPYVAGWQARQSLIGREPSGV